MTDYLFDKQGEPDPEIERLERVLRPLAYRGAPPPPPLRPPARRRRVWLGAAATAVALVIALVLLRPPRAGWTATVRAGSASFDGHAVSGQTRLPVGAWVETGASRVLLEVAGIGTVELAPGTRARIVETGVKLHELELEHGELAAQVTAPPRRFVVKTPRLTVTDLGCAFTVTVDAAGIARVVVTAGSVALADGSGPEVVVPAGASWPVIPEVKQPSVPAPPPEKPAPPKHATPKSKPAKKHPLAAPVHTTAPPPAHKTEPAIQKPAPRQPADKFGHDPFKDVERATPP